MKLPIEFINQTEFLVLQPLISIITVRLISGFMADTLNYNSPSFVYLLEENTK
jgi:hypothetical protein